MLLQEVIHTEILTLLQFSSFLTICDFLIFMHQLGYHEFELFLHHLSKISLTDGCSVLPEDPLEALIQNAFNLLQLKQLRIPVEELIKGLIECLQWYLAGRAPFKHYVAIAPTLCLIDNLTLFGTQVRELGPPEVIHHECLIRKRPLKRMYLLLDCCVKK